MSEDDLEALHGVPGAPGGEVVGWADELRGHLVAGHGAHVGGQQRTPAVDVSRGQAPVTWNDNLLLMIIRNMFRSTNCPRSCDVT